MCAGLGASAESCAALTGPSAARATMPAKEAARIERPNAGFINALSAQESDSPQATLRYLFSRIARIAAIVGPRARSPVDTVDLPFLQSQHTAGSPWRPGKRRLPGGLSRDLTVRSIAQRQRRRRLSCPK